MEYIKTMISNLGHYDSDIANAAKKALLLQRKKAIPYLVAALTNPDHVIVAETAQLLGLFREDAVAAVEALVTISFINNPKIRANAIASMGMVAEKADVCIPVLKRHMKDNDINVRRYAVAALGVFAHAANTAVNELLDALKDEDLVVREFSAGILYELGNVPLSRVKYLVNVLRDADPSVHYPITRLLGKIRRNMGMTITELVALEDRVQRDTDYRESHDDFPLLVALS
ncbi:HEAT repeat domain-containing protein [Kaarinaea lacus]